MTLLRDTLPLGSGPLLRVDARIKIIGTVALACAMAVTQTLWIAAFHLAIASTLLALARPHPGHVFRRLRAGNVVLLIVFLSLAFTHSGSPWPLLPMISVEGGHKGTLIICKGNAMLIALLALFLSTPFTAFAVALRSLKCPPKIMLLLGFVYRQLFLAAEELERMRVVARLRCFTPRTNRHTYRTFGWFVGQSLLRAADRADRIRGAMLARGFDGHFRTLHTPAAVRAWEIGACVMLAALSALLIVLDRGLFL